MLSALWELFENLVRALFDVGGALVRVVFQLFSLLAQALLWPFKALWTLLFGDWTALSPWQPAGLALWALALVAAAGVLAYGCWKRRRGL